VPDQERVIVSWVPWACIVVSVCIGAIGLAGWALDRPVLRAFVPGSVQLMPWSAVGHIVVGLAVAAAQLAREERRWSATTAAALSAVLIVIGGIPVLEYLFNWNVGFDLDLFGETVRSSGAAHPGRPAIGSALGFVGTGVALALVCTGSDRRAAVAQYLGLLVLSLAYLALVGYAYGASTLYQLDPRNPTSLPSALAFFAAGCAILTLRQDVDPVAVVFRRDIGGFVARRAILAAVAAPFVLGWLRIAGVRAGLFTSDVGLTLIIVMTTIVLAAFGWRNAFALRRLEAQRQEVENALRRSQAQLAATLESLPVGVWFADRTGRLVYANPAARSIWGGTLNGGISDMERFAVRRADTGEPIPASERGLTRAIQNGETTIDQELDVEAADGTHKIVRSAVVPLIGQDGEILGAVVLNEDITDRRTAEQEREAALAAAERRAREETALRHATAAVAAAYTVEEITARIAQSALDATDADSAFVERLDAKTGEIEVVASAAVRAIRIGPRLPYPGSLAERVIEARRPLRFHAAENDPRVPGYLTSRYPGSSILAVPMTEAGEALGALLLIRAEGGPDFGNDEVERATTFAQLASIAFRKTQLLEISQTRQRELERVLERQSWLIRGFSHDVKNPLGAADGHLSLIEQGVLDEAPDRHRASIISARRSIRAAIDLIDALIDFARAEAGQLKVQQVRTDVARIAHDVLEEYRAAAESKELALDLSTPPETPRPPSDPARVRQILGNLVSNAIKYTDAGRVEVRVGERDGNGRAPGPGHWITVDVADTGPGIPRDRQEEVFKEFTRLSPDASPGVGLGLAVSRRIARLLGGELTVTSDAGHGSTFTLWLPASGATSRNSGSGASPTV